VRQSPLSTIVGHDQKEWKGFGGGADGNNLNMVTFKRISIPTEGRVNKLGVGSLVGRNAGGSPRVIFRAFARNLPTAVSRSRTLAAPVLKARWEN